MHIATQGNNVAELGIHHGLKQTLACFGVAVPRVVPIASTHGCGHAGGADLRSLCHQFPLALGLTQTFGQPTLLRHAKHGAACIAQFIALQDGACAAKYWIAAGLGASVLTAIECPHIGQLAPSELVVQVHIGGVTGIRT